MTEKGLQGSSEEVQSLLSEHGIPFDEFLKSANSVMRNPLYTTAMKMAGAPIDEIKKALARLSNTPTTTKSTNKPCRGRTRFQRL